MFLQVTIDDLCDIMTNQTIGGELDRYAAVNSVFNQNETLDVNYHEYIEFMKNTSWNSSAALGGKHTRCISYICVFPVLNVCRVFAF